MDGEDVMEESYMMKGKSIGKRDWREQRFTGCIIDGSLKENI